MPTRRIISQVVSVRSPEPEMLTSMDGPKDDAHGEVRFKTGDRAYARTLDPRYRAWIELLETKQASGTPVFVEIDEESGNISRLLPMEAESLRAIYEHTEGLSVEFLFTPQVCRVTFGRTDYFVIRNALLAAARDRRPVYVAMDPSSGEVLEVMDREPLVPKGARASPPGQIETVITQEQCTNEFRFLAVQPHIPFAYARTCCHSRAHAMRALLNQRGIECEKIWLYAQGTELLRPVVPSFPNLTWRYHVAPLVVVLGADGRFQERVIDPSLHEYPVGVQEWIERQRAPHARAELSPGRIFARRECDAALPPWDAHLRFDYNGTLTEENLSDRRDMLAEHRFALTFKAT